MRSRPPLDVAALHAHGTLRDGAAVTGFWYVQRVARVPGATGHVSLVRVLRRTPDGAVAGHEFRCASGDDVGAAVSAAVAAGGERPGETFGIVLQRTLTWVTDPTDDAARNLSAMAGDATGRAVPDDAAEAATALLAARKVGFDAFVATLDPEAVALLREHGRLVDHLSHHEELASTLGARWPWLDRTFGRGAPLAVLLGRHPNLPLTLVRESVRDPDGAARDVARGDTDAVVARAARVLGVPARWARGLPKLADSHARHAPPNRHARAGDATFPERTADPALNAVDLASALPQAWVPDDAAGWNALVGMLPALDLARDLGAWDPASAAHLLPSGGRWAAFAARLRAATGSVPLGLAVRDLADVATAYACQVLAPARCMAEGVAADAVALAHPSATNVASAMLSSGRSLPRMLETSRDWHAASHRNLAALAGLAGSGKVPGGWPAGLPDHSEGDLELVVLTTVADLLGEGGAGPDAHGMAGLAHCVGGYAGTCRSGRSRIASIRRVLPDGRRERLSTVEFGTAHMAESWYHQVPTVLQHRGRRNAPPPAAARAFVESYREAFRRGDLRGDGDALVALPDAGTVADAAGYDWSVPGSWEAARALWRPFVPGPLRDLDARTLHAVAEDLRVRGTTGWSAEPPGIPPTARVGG